MNDASNVYARGDQLSPVSKPEGALSYLRRVWERRAFAFEAPRHELRALHVDTVLGNAWLVLNPLLMVLVYYIFFGVLAGTNRGVDDFVTFLTVGITIYNFGARTITSAALAITRNLGLIRSLQFPRALLPLSTVVAQAYAFGPVLLVTLVIALIESGLPGPTMVLLIPALALQSLFNLGASFFVARANTIFPDVENLLVFAFRLLFYTSGILYSIDQFVETPTVRRLFIANPFYDYVTMARHAIMGINPPAGVWLAGTGWAFVSVVAGFAFFRRGEADFGRA